MCVVIDADTFSEVSESNNQNFEPLRKWIERDGHTVIHGGSRYKEELSNHGKFRRYLKGLDKVGRAHKLDDKDVDDTQNFLENKFVLASYNDHHIVAILFISGCMVVSSHDQGFHKLIKNCCNSSGKRRIINDMPSLKVNKPKIYQKEKHKSFLNDSNVYHCCI